MKAKPLPEIVKCTCGDEGELLSSLVGSGVWVSCMDSKCQHYKIRKNTEGEISTAAARRAINAWNRVMRAAKEKK